MIFSSVQDFHIPNCHTIKSATQTFTKEIIIYQKSLWVQKSKHYVHYLYQNVSHINKFLFLKLEIHHWKSLDREVLIFTLLFKERWFTGLFEILPYIIVIARLIIKDFNTSFFYGWVGCHLQHLTLLITHPPSSNLDYLTTSPFQNFKRKKKRRPDK